MEPAELTEMAHLNLQIGKTYLFYLFHFSLKEKWHVHVTADEDAVVSQASPCRQQTEEFFVRHNDYKPNK